MSRVPDPKGLWAVSAIILVGVFLVSPGFFVIDESIYYLGARAIAEGGALGIDNGFDRFHSDSLKLKLLVDGPQGLTPQYPPGSSLLAAPLLPLLGPRSFILLNAIPGIATLFTARKICLLQFGNEAIARTAVIFLTAGSFWLAYALSIWPHALSAYFALQAYWFALRHIESEGENERDAVLAGLFAGLGMLFRLDAILAVPAIGLMLVLFAPRFIRSSAWFAVGVLPSLASMSALNFLKFGSPNPLSYGNSSGGGTDLAAYGPVLLALCLGLAVVIVLRKKKIAVRRKETTAAIVALGALLLLIPATRPWLLQLWNGFQAVVVDMKTVEEQRQFIAAGPGDTVRFYGFVKKALGQSLPWIGLAAALLTCRIRHAERRAFATLAIFIVTLSFPFIWQSWHGGGGADMRYFLPVLPALSILCARLFHDFWQAATNPRIYMTAGVLVALFLTVAWTKWHPSRFEGVQQIASTYVLLATAMTAAIGAFQSRFRSVASGLVVSLGSAGFLMAMQFAAFDFAVTLKARSVSQATNATLATFPARSLIFSRPEWMAVHLPGNGSIVADNDTMRDTIDATLAGDALDAGYRVFIVEYDPELTVPPGFDFVESPYALPRGRAIELRRMPDINAKPWPDEK